MTIIAFLKQKTAFNQRAGLGLDKKSAPAKLGLGAGLLKVIFCSLLVQTNC